jgi:hypothetical protein
VNEVIGDLVVRQTRRRFKVDIVGQEKRRPRRHRDVLGVAAGALAELAGTDEHLLADHKLGDVAAAFDHGAGHLDAGDGRQLRHPWIDALAHHDFGTADADRIRLDQHLIVARARRRHVHIVEHGWIAGAREQDCLHGGFVLVGHRAAARGGRLIFPLPQDMIRCFGTRIHDASS